MRCARDYEFSRASVEEHRKQGRSDALEILAHPCWRDRDKPKEGVITLDLTRNGQGSNVQETEHET